MPEYFDRLFGGGFSIRFQKIGHIVELRINMPDSSPVRSICNTTG
jgi:hypothetical protein